MFLKVRPKWVYNYFTTKNTSQMPLKSPLHNSPLNLAYHRFEFIHIPKCGGTSIHGRLAEVLGPGYSHGRKFLQEAKEALALKNGSESRAITHGKSFAKMRSRLIGAGAHVGSGQNPINQIAPNGMFMVRFALVRHPLERLVSLRRHCLDHSAHRLNQQLRNSSAATLKQFILANIEHPEIVNPQVRQLSGLYSRISGIPPSPDFVNKLVNEGIIDAIFSITELELFYEYINARIPGFGTLKMENASRSKINLAEIEEARELVEECCRVDLEMYNLVTQ